MKRAIIIVMDSCGAGEAPDAADYGDSGSDTLGHTSAAVGGFDLPTLAAAGLGNLHGRLVGMPPTEHPTMGYGRLAESSAAKDSTTGHWELAGIVTETAFRTFTDSGFPSELIAAIETETGHKFMGNYAASGTVIIEELGPRHLETGELILYTSADSVFQIAAHEDIASVDELYRICEIARRHCNDYQIGRVIARPFVGSPGSFQRTYKRHDYAMPPHSDTLLDHAKAAGMSVLGIGKINDLFAGKGLTEVIKTEGDLDGMKQTRAALGRVEEGIIFTNLVDLDMVYGHRENPEGYYEGLQLIDMHLPHILSVMQPDDLLVISADHGNDPTDGSTDHTREYVPLLVAGLNAAGVNLGDRDQYSDVAATLAEWLELPAPARGRSFLAEIS